MLIIKKFHDYYDTASVYGIDKTCIYNRITEEKPGKFDFADGLLGHWPHEETFNKAKGGLKNVYKVNKYVIGFCGQFYPVVIVEKGSHTKDGYKFLISFAFYSVEKVYAFFTKEKIDLKVEKYSSYWSMREFTVKSDTSLRGFFDTTRFKKMEENFVKYKCPVFVYGRLKDDSPRSYKGELLILNPRLEDYGFAKVKGPVTAYQDIFMYISGVIGIPEAPMIKLSDKELAKKRGHDGKYSFKKTPGKGKWR